jgi:formylglycine-generating enzyme required for sulfatase activity
MRTKLLRVLIILFIVPLFVTAQSRDKLLFSEDKKVTGMEISGKLLQVPRETPIVSFKINEKDFSTTNNSPAISFSIREVDRKDDVVQWVINFKNISGDTILLHNVHPFDPANAEALITGKGNHGLSRTHLFLRGRSPVNVIVPDNAWELGYAAVPLTQANPGNAAVAVSGQTNNKFLAALTRRDRSPIKLGARRRFETQLYPNGTVEYNMFALPYSGEWQQGLTRMFQEKMLFDTDQFNDTLYKRKDLQWIRHTYVLHLMDAWDKFYYDIEDGKYHLDEFLQRGKKLYGGDDIVSIWPTWPTLGLDQRNQFDLFNDLPGGIKAMQRQAEISRAMGTRFFICYNPWDEGTNKRNHFEGLSDLIKATTADGVVLDTKAEASKEIQDAADKVRKGVVMYSEGMAVPKDMHGIVSGRVHNALYYPPLLNLNKLINPEFAIYRVAELFKEKINREFFTSFFNGYGTEINIMAPGQPDWVEEQYKILGRTTRILREHTNNFVNRGYTPLISTTHDSIWVNQWKKEDKTIYTIYSVIPQGYKGDLFEVQPAEGTHFVDLWNHRLLEPKEINGRKMIEVQTDAFNASYLGTNNEGAVSCIAQLPVIVEARMNGDELIINSHRNKGNIRVWAGAPSYEKKPLVVRAQNQVITVSKHFGRFEGDLILQYFEDGIQYDETIVTIKPGTARRISVSKKTSVAGSTPKDMVKIPSGKFLFKTTHGDEFISYPQQDENKIHEMTAFYMDKYPVTNKQFYQFLVASKYRPSDPDNFLKHWKNGKVPAGKENFPVVYISYEDAKAYATWAGKRLPTEMEWQYAAQANDGREWPWSKSVEVKRRNEYVNETLTVLHLEGIDSTFVNLGNGKLTAVGSYPKGANPYGLQDLVGSLWQLTNDLYMSGSHRYLMLKGGSYFKPSGSWWYVQGGPRELHYRQHLLRVSQGFERNATVGFRCVKDAE